MTERIVAPNCQQAMLLKVSFGRLVMRAMIAIPLFCLALNAAAECPVQHPRVQPAIFRPT